MAKPVINDFVKILRTSDKEVIGGGYVVGCLGANRFVVRVQDFILRDWILDTQITKFEDDLLVVPYPEVKEWRATIRNHYDDPNCPGHKDLSARQGYYVRSLTEDGARLAAARIIGDSYTIDLQEDW